MDISALLLVFIPLFVIVDPFASLGLFLGLTSQHTRRQRIRIAAKASLFAALVLFLFATAGRTALDFLGIEIYALQGAGGLLLAMIGLNMLKEGREIPRREIQLPTGGDYDPSEDSLEDPTFVPLGLPMLAGPGAISLVIVQTTNAGLPMVATSIGLTMLLAALLLMAAARMQHRVGPNGARVVTRIMGILTVAFAVQYMFDGISGWLAVREAAAAVNGTLG